MDTTDPDITFDVDGICSHCTRYDEKFRSTVEAATRGERIGELQSLVTRIKSAGVKSRYDCVVGVSGGVDSTYVLMKAVELGLRPLAVHFDSGWNSDLAVRNIQNATSLLGVDLETDVVDWSEMRDLQLSFFTAGVANCDIPTDHAFPAVALKSATKYRAKFILSGSNAATESILPRSWGHNSADLRYLRAIHRAHGSRKLQTYPTLGLMKKEVWYRYLRKVRTVSPLNYLPYNAADARSEISQNLKWQDYGEKHHESIFTRFFQGYYLPTRFGYDKRLAHYSSLILSHQVSRDAALHTVETEPPYEKSLQISDLAFVAGKLEISTSKLNDLITAPLEEIDEYSSNEKLYALAFRARDLVTARS